MGGGGAAFTAKLASRDLPDTAVGTKMGEEKTAEREEATLNCPGKNRQEVLTGEERGCHSKLLYLVKLRLVAQLALRCLRVLI